jgi:serine/threonine protein kinase
MTIGHARRYRLLSLLGKGGYGRVFLAQETTGTFVAVKYAFNHTLEHEQAILTHIRERGIAGVPRLLDTIGGGRWDSVRLVLEYVDGQSIGEIAARSHSLSTVIDNLSEFFQIMACLHTNAIVHNDLSENNILLGKDGHTYVLDFGLAQMVSASVPGRIFQEELDAMITVAACWMLTIPQDQGCPLRHHILTWLHEAREHIARGEGAGENANTFLHTWQHMLAQATTATTALLPR